MSSIESQSSQGNSDYHHRRHPTIPFSQTWGPPSQQPTSIDDLHLKSAFRRDIISPTVTGSSSNLGDSSVLLTQRSINDLRSQQRILSSSDLNSGVRTIPFPSAVSYSNFGFGGQASLGISQQGQGLLTVGNSRISEYDICPQSVILGPQRYLTQNMAHNTNNYGWHSRPSQPLQPSPLGIDQQSYAHSQGYSSPGFPVGYAPQQPSSQSFYQPAAPSPQYVYSQNPGISQDRQNPRSSSLPYHFPSTSLSASSSTIPDQAFSSPPPSYVLTHSNYYLPQGSSLPSNQSSLAVSPQPHSMATPESMYPSPESAPAPSESDQPIRVVSYRPKPQCWDHGCNGREFSTFSNLLRHQREKSGVVAKAECPSCGAVFTRTTARNIHVAQGKCKSGRESSAE